jgi:hypothetical protein
MKKSLKVHPAITRQVSLFEFDTRKKSKRAVNHQPPRPDNFLISQVILH